MLAVAVPVSSGAATALLLGVVDPRLRMAIGVAVAAALAQSACCCLLPRQENRRWLWGRADCAAAAFGSASGDDNPLPHDCSAWPCIQIHSRQVLFSQCGPTLCLYHTVSTHH